MNTENNIGANNPAEGVRVFDDLNQLEQVVLNTLVLIGTAHSGAIGKCTLQDIRQALTAVLAQNELGFPASGAVAAALKPNDEHRQNSAIHITDAERTAWNGKAEPVAVEAALRSAKDYVDLEIRKLSDATKIAIEAAVRDTKDYLQSVVSGLVDNAPEALDTLSELSKALGDNPNFATEVATELGKRVTKEALAEELAKYVPKSGDTTIAGTLTATDFQIP